MYPIVIPTSQPAAPALSNRPAEAAAKGMCLRAGDEAFVVFNWITADADPKYMIQRHKIKRVLGNPRRYAFVSNRGCRLMSLASDCRATFEDARQEAGRRLSLIRSKLPDLARGLREMDKPEITS